MHEEGAPDESERSGTWGLRIAMDYQIVRAEFRNRAVNDRIISRIKASKEGDICSILQLLLPVVIR